MIQVKLDCQWSIGNASEGATGQQIFSLLEAIHRTGSLNKAAPIIGLSYRHLWNLIGKWSELLGQPVAVLERGRGARLTSFGEKLLWADQKVRARLGPQLENLASELELELNDTLVDGRPVLRVHASHDLALAELREMLNQRVNGPRIELQFRGSLDCLASLARSQCDVAGFHIPESIGSKNVLLRYRKWLKPRSQKLVEFVTRQQGLILATGNPKKIYAISDLAKQGVRFVNRQQGSGTRLLLDMLLDEAGVEKNKIQGIHHEEFTHAAVAATVASGKADAGVGIEAVARQFELDFVPIASERYFLITRQNRIHLPAFKGLISAIQSSEFKNMISGLPGYDAAHAGEITPLTKVFPRLKTDPS
ncbi:MAG TPA: substrate-binding domain-containing protein [Burkholderiales bacterium]|nr:substrate-binding domain-containing protein [Burkholderiales bacterium]